jgi:acetate kinase
MELVTGILSAFFGGIAQLIGMSQQAQQAKVANDAEKDALRQQLLQYQEALKKMQEEMKKQQQQQQMMLFGVIGVVVVIVIVMMVARR